LQYDRIFKHVHISYLFSNITVGGLYFSEILNELSGTYFSLAAFEVVLYVILVVTYTYKSRFLAMVVSIHICHKPNRKVKNETFILFSFITTTDLCGTPGGMFKIQILIGERVKFNAFYVISL